MEKRWLSHADYGIRSHDRSRREPEHGLRPEWYITVVIPSRHSGRFRSRKTRAASPAPDPVPSLEGKEECSHVIVQRVGAFGSADIHRVLFGAKTPARRSLDELKEGIAGYARKRYARG